ncbi:MULTISPECIES: formate dehydrogenase subunit delta [Novosphingobium]|uniref:formate dehydrogenase subunit delta n=1 Tax=Novosphingobium TaxID=165696 RepID=UPI001CD24CB7|nr:formate dehydrogenase subunit delta [Novosphingobium percolationis]
MSGTDHLVRMAEQIAANLATAPDPAGETAQHIAKFWTPVMIADLAGAKARLGPVAAAALDQLRAHG